MVQQSEKPAVVLETVAINSLRPYQGNARIHSKKQVRQIADSIKKFGFTNPILIGDDDQIIAGHGRAEAAKLLGMEMVPALRLSHLDAAQRRAYVIADNKLALKAGWDRQILAIELQALVDLEFDVGVTAFSMAEIDLLVNDATASPGDARTGAENDVPHLAPTTEAVSHIGDLWVLGQHRLLCGDDRHIEMIANLLHDERPDPILVEFDPWYSDQIIRRFEQITGKRAKLAGNGRTFDEVAEQRAGLAPQRGQQ